VTPPDLVARLLPILSLPTGTTPGGWPYLQREAWEAFRDGIPHLFGQGLVVLRAVDEIEGSLAEDDPTRPNLLRSCKVARQIVRTAAITAPPDLWLMRHVLGFLSELGLASRLLAGEAIYANHCRVQREGVEHTLDPRELEADLGFLLARGVVEQYDESYRIAGHPRVRRLLEGISPVPASVPISVTRLWRTLFLGQSLEPSDLGVLLDLSFTAPRLRHPEAPNHWIASLEEVELGYRLVPLVLGLRAAERTAELKKGVRVKPSTLSASHPIGAAGALEVLCAAGWTQRRGEDYEVTAIGARGFARGPGPFGIIETYHPYMARGARILLEGRGGVWVRRGENVGASQDANRRTFRLANDALDRFCETTGFSYGVFVEHAIGRGEATRQRFGRNADALSYVGADLELASIEAARAEQGRGHLPAEMLFVEADIGRPDVLLEALRGAGLEPEGAVMLVGNGFHEVRQQTDERMVDVFRGYEQAGILLLFTEENALSVDDLRATAWNTYHAGFKYVHEKSGQGLRPADPRPPVRLGRPLRAAWSACAQRAGYRRADDYCSRTRSIYPYTPPSGHNPSISVSHMFVPQRIATKLGL
jgi:hypothetical protein